MESALQIANQIDKAEVLDKAAQALEDPLFWFTEFCNTYDPHERSIRPFGNVFYKDRADYIPHLAEIIRVTHEGLEYYDEDLEEWVRTFKFLVPKSRQMRMSWTFVGYFTWESIAEPMSYTFFQSKIETDAGWSAEGQEAQRSKAFEDTIGLGLLDRSKIIFDNMPHDFGISISCPKKPPKMIFSNRSTIHAVPQNTKAFRQYTATGILADEAAFQENAQAAYGGAEPTMAENSRYIAVSSPNGRDDFFYPKVHDLG